MLHLVVALHCVGLHMALPPSHHHPLVVPSSLSCYASPPVIIPPLCRHCECLHMAISTHYSPCEQLLAVAGASAGVVTGVVTLWVVMSSSSSLFQSLGRGYMVLLHSHGHPLPALQAVAHSAEVLTSSSSLFPSLGHGHMVLASLQFPFMFCM